MTIYIWGTIFYPNTKVCLRLSVHHFSSSYMCNRATKRSWTDVVLVEEHLFLRHTLYNSLQSVSHPFRQMTDREWILILHNFSTSFARLFCSRLTKNMSNAIYSLTRIFSQLQVSSSHSVVGPKKTTLRVFLLSQTLNWTLLVHPLLFWTFLSSLFCSHICSQTSQTKKVSKEQGVSFHLRPFPSLFHSSRQCSCSPFSYWKLFGSPAFQFSYVIGFPVDIQKNLKGEKKSRFRQFFKCKKCIHTNMCNT